MEIDLQRWSPAAKLVEESDKPHGYMIRDEEGLWYLASAVDECPDVRQESARAMEMPIPEDDRILSLIQCLHKPALAALTLDAQNFAEWIAKPYIEQIQAQQEEIERLKSGMNGLCEAHADLGQLCSTLQATVTRLSAPDEDHRWVDTRYERQCDTCGCIWGSTAATYPCVASRTDQESKPSKEGQ